MNPGEKEKFQKQIANAYEELITCRPEQPLEHFIYYLLSTLPDEQRNKDSTVRQFFHQYAETYAKNVRKIL